MNPTTDHAVLTAMLAPAFFLTATASLLLSANNRLARVVDRLRSLVGQLEGSSPEHRPELELQISRHRVLQRWMLDPPAQAAFDFMDDALPPPLRRAA